MKAYYHGILGYSTRIAFITWPWGNVPRKSGGFMLSFLLFCKKFKDKNLTKHEKTAFFSIRA
jgi:hypothetical protein